MGYAIVGGIGLLIGIGFALWALLERSKRHEAERAADLARTKEAEQRRLASKNAAAAQNLEMQHGRMSEQLTILRTAIQETKKRLAECQDPEAIKDFLDSELEGGSV